MADLVYPYVSVTASYGDLESTTITVSSNDTEGSPVDFDDLVDSVKTYVSGLTGVTSVSAQKTTLVNTSV